MVNGSLSSRLSPGLLEWTVRRLIFRCAEIAWWWSLKIGAVPRKVARPEFLGPTIPSGCWIASPHGSLRIPPPNRQRRTTPNRLRVQNERTKCSAARPQPNFRSVTPRIQDNHRCSSRGGYGQTIHDIVFRFKNQINQESDVGCVFSVASGRHSLLYGGV